MLGSERGSGEGKTKHTGRSRKNSGYQANRSGRTAALSRRKTFHVEQFHQERNRSMSFPTQHFPDESRMQKDCSLLRFDLTGEQAELLKEFAGILLRRSKKTNLIGPRERYRLWERHILESISYIQLIDQNRKVVDIGSGAGFPGLVLGILGLKTVLLEPRRKRHEFLSHAIRKLGLSETEIFQVRIENANPDILGNQFIARTVAPPDVLLDLIRRRKEGDSTLIYRVPADIELTKGKKYIKLECPPLDRPGFLVQYRTCSES